MKLFNEYFLGLPYDSNLCGCKKNLRITSKLPEYCDIIGGKIYIVYSTKRMDKIIQQYLSIRMNNTDILQNIKFSLEFKTKKQCI
jgi:uncharacterized protein YqkB